MRLKRSFLAIVCFLCLLVNAIGQEKNKTGLLTGNVVDEKGKALDGATVQLRMLADSTVRQAVITDKLGGFLIRSILPGYYRLCISHVEGQTLCLDSIWFRAERLDFNIADITLKTSTSEQLSNVVIYAEKPLVQSKDGNLTYNASESATAAGSSAAEVLAQVPLVSKDADGKITVRGKEPRILIDDKPVELNLQQLQDLLESMPGSSIEKIEVLTNPPPQYASEQGGVINIVTKKGRVGRSGRISFAAGTRGEWNANAGFSYRKNGLSLSFNAGYADNRFRSEGHSERQNRYLDSVNYFNTAYLSLNRSKRPNLRMNLDYELNKRSLFNLVLLYNSNQSDNQSPNRFININQFGNVYKQSDRTIHSASSATNPGINLSYQYKPRAGETLKFIVNFNNSHTNNDREFYQRFYDGNGVSWGMDSLQRQLIDSRVNNYSLRTNYDRMLTNKKTFLSTGVFYTHSANHVINIASYKKRPEGIMMPLEQLSNDFWFYQGVASGRFSIKQLLGKEASITVGTSAEHTAIHFDLKKENRQVDNNYLTWLPFANLNRSFKDKLSLTLAYRRTINRPGIGQLNPTIDFSDPYNVRFGNPFLFAASAHQFDLIVSRTQRNYFMNLGAGYNIVEDIFSQVRTLMDGGKTQVTWENISGRKEIEISTWNGVTLSRQLKMTANASITVMRYGAFDRLVRKFRNGASFSSSLGYTWVPNENWNSNGSIGLNRVATPQGFANWNGTINLALQRKLLHRKLLITVNAVDPFINQRRKQFTYGPNFTLETFNLTLTQNFRFTLAYVLSASKPVTRTAKKGTIPLNGH